ncbi:vacuolar ATPase assembly protein VMA22 [Genypterus blacodes]|uniref:vacuolar ATPase assembly protein VMA22 n=1 Tax=Genypterus blacodes TaxID=154954 RepID=UPI003F76C58C
MGLSEVEELCHQLDEKLLIFMDQLELLEEKRNAFNSLIEQGWFSISQARYSMGNKQVSALQYASEIEPLVCVNTRSLDSGLVEFCTERATQKSKNESVNAARPVEDVGPQEEGVRRRHKPQKDIVEPEARETPSSDKAPEAPPVKRREQNPQQDPLKWFGILVPQSLKGAQSAFKQVIELSAEIATLQSAILDTREELKQGMKQKRTMQEKNAAAAQTHEATD